MSTKKQRLRRKHFVYRPSEEVTYYRNQYHSSYQAYLREKENLWEIITEKDRYILYLSNLLQEHAPQVFPVVSLLDKEFE